MEINLFKSTIGLGLIRLPDGSQKIIQFKTAREIKCRVFDKIFWVKEPTEELLEAAFYATRDKSILRGEHHPFQILGR